MSYTKRQFVNEAYALIGYADYNYDLQPEDLEIALRAMDAMLGQWYGKGIDLGYPIPANPESSSLDTETDVAQYAEQPIIYNLALKIAPRKGKQVPQEIKNDARTGYLLLLAKAALPSTQSIVDRVYGAGSKYWRGAENPFIQSTADGSGTSGTSTAIAALFTQLGDILQGDASGSYRVLKNQLAATTAPTVNDDIDLGYNISSFWFDISADTAYVCLDNTADTAVWIDITAGAAGGEANTASSVGTGTSVYKQKSGVDIELNAIKSENNLLAVALDTGTNDIELTVSQTNINSGVSITASQVSDFDTEVSNNTSVAANTAKTTNATHTGEVIGSGALTVADNIIDEANLKLDTGPTNDYILTADSTKSGGMKWAAPSAGSGDVTGPASSTADNLATFNGTSGKIIKDGAQSVAGVLARANHTGTQTASTISDFDTEVSNNSSVAANTSKVTNATHSGEVTGSGVLTIANDAVTYAKIQNVVSDNVILGNNAGAGGVVTELTATEARTLLNVADGATANTGTVDTSGTPVANDFAKFTDADTIEGRSYSEVRTDLNVADGSEANTIDSDPTGVTGADQVTNVMSLTTAEYAAIGTPNTSTLYIITDAT